jgi:hypothetical protein
VEGGREKKMEREGRPCNTFECHVCVRVHTQADNKRIHKKEKNKERTRKTSRAIRDAPKTWPKCPSQAEHKISTRRMPHVLSSSVCSSVLLAIGWESLHTHIPLSNNSFLADR